MNEWRKRNGYNNEGILNVGSGNAGPVAILKLYKRNTEANDIFELVFYIEGLETKLNQAIGELSTIREQLSELQEMSNRRSLKEVLTDMSAKLEESCENMKQQIFTIAEYNKIL